MSRILRGVRFALSALFVLSYAGFLWGQAGSIEITVSDPAGRRIPEAKVLIQNPSGAVVAEKNTARDGKASFGQLVPAAYTVEVVASSFAQSTQTVRVGAAPVRLEVTLELSTISTIVEVEAPAAQPVALLESDASEMAESPTADLVEKLAANPGVNLIRRGGRNFDPVVQGLREAEVAMVVDGARTFAAGPARMDSELSHVEPGQVDEARVISGPYALSEGAGALSAIVVRTSQVPRFDDWKLLGRTNAGYGFNGARRFGFARLDAAGDRLGFSLRAAGSQGNDYRAGDFGDSPLSIPGDYAQHQFGGKMRLNLADNHELRFGALYDEQTNVDYPGRLLNAVHFLLRSFQGDYLVSNPSGALRTARFGLYLNKKSHRMTNDGKPTAMDMPGRTPPFALDVSVPAEADTFGGSGRLGFEPGGSWRIEAGFDFYNLDQNARRFVSRRSNGLLIFNDVIWPDAEINDQGVYLQATRSFERGEFSSTLRFDFVQAGAGIPSDFFLENTNGDLDQTEQDTSFSLAGRYRLLEGLSVGGGFGRAVRPASALERFSDRFPSTKFQVAAEFLGEPGMAPESSTQGDLQLQFARGGLTLDAGVFYRRIDNYITVVADPDLPRRLPLSPAVVYRYVSGDHANFRGFHFGGAFRWPWAELRMQGAKTIADDIEESTAAVGFNEPLIGIPPLELQTALRVFAPGGRRYWGELSMRNAWNQKRVAASRLEQPSPGFTTFGLRFGLDLPHELSLHFGVENLGDKFYFEHLNSLNPFTRQRIPDLGRNVYVQVGKTW